MRIGIVGAGIAGLAAAWMLEEQHEVVLFEREPRVGGHVHTCSVPWGGHTVPVELGFKYYYRRSYPYLSALVQLLGLETRSREADFTVSRSSGGTLLLPPRSWVDVARLLGRPRSLALVRRLRRFFHSGLAVVASRDWSMSLREYLQTDGYGETFGTTLLYPLVAASWGMPLESAPEMPVYCAFKILGPDRRGRFSYLEVSGGAGRYIEALAAELRRVDLRLGVGARAIRRAGTTPRVLDDAGVAHDFDHVVIATSARDAAALLEDDPCSAERCDVLRRFGYFKSEIAVHSDPRLMPPRRRDWSLLNQFHEPERAWTTEWAGRDVNVDVFRSWLAPGGPTPSDVHCRVSYEHLLTTTASPDTQRRLAARQGVGAMWTIGMYAMDVDTHESALVSVFPVVRALAPGATRLARLQADASQGECRPPEGGGR